MEKEQIKKIFDSLYGTEIDIVSSPQPQNKTENFQKSCFIKSIIEWRNAYKIKDTLFKTYGIDVTGYDSLIYDALENLLAASIGVVKATLVMSYIYCPVNIDVEPLKYIDKNQKTYTVKTPEDLYLFISNINEDDFYIDEQ